MVNPKRACDPCHRRKIQCDRSGPGDQCNWCRHHNLSCTVDRVIGRRKKLNDKGNSQRGLAKRLGRIEKGIARATVSDDGGHISSEVSPASTLSSLDRTQLLPQQTTDIHTCPICQAGSSSRRPSRRLGNAPLGQIYFSGENFGAVCSLNGIPHFTLHGEQWIYSRTGEWPRFHNPYVGDSHEMSDHIRGILAVPTRPCITHGQRGELPEKWVLQSLLQAFLSSDFSLVFPLVDGVLFEETVKSAYDSPNTPPTIEDISNKACVLAFLSISCNRFPHLEAVSYVDRDACERGAQNLISEFIEDASISTLQTVFILLLLESDRGRWQASSMYHAIACRTVCALGGHTLVVTPPKHHELTAQEREDRHLRMLFWLCYLFDKDIALRTGQPPIICDDFCDLTLPDKYVQNHFETGRFRNVADDSQMPWLPGDLRLSLLQSKAVNSLYSARSFRKSDAELLRTIRELDEELESWRLSIPAEFAPALSVRKHFKIADDLNVSKSMLHIELHLAYHYLLNTIHSAGGRCMVDRSGPGKENTFGLQSSRDLSVEASRSTLIYLSAAAHRIAGEAFWFFTFYPVSALMTIFFNVLRNPLHEYAAHDVELLSSASELIRSMPIHRVTPHEDAYLRKMDGFVAELSRLGKCAIAKSQKESNGVS